MVYCNCEDCLFWAKLDESVVVKPTPRYKPRFEDSYRFTGRCGREETGLVPRVIRTRDWSHKLQVCAFHSDKGISGRMDFSKLGKGGHIDEETGRELQREKADRERLKKGSKNVY